MVTGVAESTSTEGQPESGSSARARRVAAGLAFTGGLALVLLYGLRGGGAFDSVIFQENGLVIWWILALCFALGLLPLARPGRMVMLLCAALVAYLAWTALSLLWTNSSELTYTEVTRVIGYVGVVVLIATVLNRETWQPAAAGLGVGALVICIAAVGSRLDPTLFGRDELDTVLHQDRLSVPFGYWNAVGAWGAMTAAIALAWSAHDKSRVRRAIALGAVPIAGLTTYLTYSRTGVGLFAAVVIVSLFAARNRLTTVIHMVVAAAGSGLVVLAARGEPAIAHSTGTAGAGTVLLALAVAVVICALAAVLTGSTAADRARVPRPVARPLLGVFAVAVVVAAVAVGPQLVRHAWHSFTHVSQSTGSAQTNTTARLTSLSGTRYPLWKVTLKAFDAHPVKGTGAGTTRFFWDQHATDAESIHDAHNIWLQNMGELGIVGLALIVVFAVAALAIALRTRRRAQRSLTAGAAAAFLTVFIVYLIAATVDWMWESTAVTVLAIAGVATVGVRLSGGRPRPGIPMRIGLVVCALAAGAAVLPGLLSTEAVRHSQAAERSGDADRALGWAQAAVDAEPWSATAYEQRALVRESAGQYARAARDLHSAITREPQNYVHWLLLARVQTERGRIKSAVMAYNRSRRLYPRADVFTTAAAARR